MKRDWLWDRRTSLARIKRIFTNPDNPDYIRWAALLLSRKNVPREVFRDYIKPLDFCKKWLQIKRRMRKDSWNNPRIEFWQAVYEKLLEKYRQSGRKILVRKKKEIPNKLCKDAGNILKNTRIEEGFTQKGLADKLRVSQQLISRIESGYENISLVTLWNIANQIGRKIKLTIEK